MRQRLKVFVGFYCILVSVAPTLAEEVGLIPIPIFREAAVSAGVTIDPTTGYHVYGYTISNPDSNTGEIIRFAVDISRPSSSIILSSDGLTIPRGFLTKNFNQEVASFRGDHVDMVSVGIALPDGSGWRGGLWARGFAGFSSNDGALILPGQTMGGFKLISPGLPTIRKISIEPAWHFLVENHDAILPEERQRAREIEDSLPFLTQTLGPMAIKPGSFEHWNQVRDDLNQAITLGWVPDTTLGTTLLDLMTQARAAFDARNGTLSKTRLQMLIDNVVGSNPSAAPF